MKDLTVTDAPRAATKLVKSLGTRRRKLSETSKAEQRGERGARKTRLSLTENLRRDIEAAEQAIQDTEDLADQFERAAFVLTAKDRSRAHTGLAKIAAKCVRLGVPSDTLRDMCGHAAKRAREAAERAQARIDTSEHDLKSAVHLAVLLAKLPEADFDVRNPDVKAARDEYNFHVTQDRKQKAHRK